MKWHSPHTKSKSQKIKYGNTKTIKLKCSGKGNTTQIQSNYLSDCKKLNMNDKIFKTPSDYDDLLILNRFEKSESDFLIIEGYKASVFSALQRLRREKGNLAKDSQIYSILFMFRHYLELIMKHTIRNFKLANNEITDDEVGYVSGHSIKKFWEELKEYIDRIETESTDSDDYQLFDNLISELNEIDRDSFNFRYPYKGVRSQNDTIVLCIPEQMNISLKNLMEVICKITRFIEGINDLSYVQVDASKSQ